jgi:tight adherence protein B
LREKELKYQGVFLKMSRFLLSLFLLPSIVLGQEASSSASELNFFSDVLGKQGLLVAIAIIFFTYSYKNSVKLFAWIEEQTYGTRDFVLKKCEILFFEINPNYVTYALLFLTFGFSIIVMSIFFVMGKYTMGVVLGVLVSILGWKTPKPFMNYLVTKRVEKYETQMVDALNLLSNGLRAGLSVPQSIGMVVEELPAPVSQEFNLILQQTKIGVPLDEAFDNLAKRVPTQDNDMFVSSVNILRETGGNLAEVFDTIAGVIRERVRLKQKIATYVAQGKMQGGMIASMPTLMGAYFGSTDPTFIDTLFGTPIGNVVLVIAAALNIFGAFMMWKVIQIKA